MNKEQMKKMRAEYSALSNQCTFLLKKKVKVKNVEEDQLGYTYMSNKVAELFVAWEHELYKNLHFNAIQKRFFRKGVCAHELLHQLLTNFSYSHQRESLRKEEERQLFSTFLNILEDPAIEYFAPTQFGGDFLKSLRFTIAKVYKASPPIGDEQNAYSQLINALVQFGDMGFIKGNFTFPEAEEAYKKTLPLFYKGITEPSGKKRIDIGEEIFDSLQPLWQEVADDIKAMQDFMKMLEDMGVTMSSGTGRGKTPDEQPNSDSSNERKKKVVKSLQKQNGDSGNSSSSGKSSDDNNEQNSSSSTSSKEKNNKSQSSDSSDGSSGTSSKNEKDQDKDSNSSSSSSKEENDESDKDDSSSNSSSSDKGDNQSNEEDNDSEEEQKGSSNKSEKISFDDAEDDGEGNFTKESDGVECDSSSSNEDNESDNSGNPEYVLPSTSGTIAENEIDFTEYELTDEDIARIEVEINKELHDEEVLNVQFTGDTTPLLEADGIADIGRCLNIRVKPNVSEEAIEKYNIIVNNYSAEINRTVKVLKDIFALDRVKEKFGHSGKVKPKYVSSVNGIYTRKGLVTENLFNKRQKPEDVSDIAVAIAVDESGSMSSYLNNTKSRCECARETCIAMAEIFSKLDIPVYIMGYTACGGGYDTTHHHYVTWKNKKADRMSLLNLNCSSMNRDGASIRYLNKLLKKQPAKRKLLFVISDGQPSAYSGTSNAVADTALALKEARKNCDVIGIVLGNDTDEVLQGFYQKNYVQVKSNESLFVAITKMLRKIIQ